MKPEWKDFLASNGAEFDDNGLSSFGNPERELRASLGGNTITDLSHDGLISVHGADAEQLLQGQLTNNIPDLSNGRTQLAGLCTHKGRMMAMFRLFKHGDSIYLRLPGNMLEPVAQRLSMFVLMSDVTLEDSSNTYVRIGLAGPNAQKELESALGTAPVEVDDAIAEGDISVLRVPAQAGHQRYEIYGGLESMKSLWDSLNVNAAPVGPFAWNLAEVLAGIPNVYPETAEAFVPQMANLQAINGISFRKGCYTGQEVIARMQFRGELKRRMFIFRTQGQTVAPGMEVFVTGKASAAGKVVDVANHPDGDMAGLAVLKLGSLEADLRLGSGDGESLTVVEPPYSFDADTD